MSLLTKPCTHYDRKVDAALIYFQRDVSSERTEELDDTRFVDYDARGALVAVELLDVSKGVSLEGLPAVEPIRTELNRLASTLGWRIRY